MRVTTYQQSLRALQPIVPPLFDALQEGLTASLDDHRLKRLRRKSDPHYFSHTARRITCERLRAEGLLVTDADHERSVLRMSGIQVQHAGALLWVFRSPDQVPLPVSGRKQSFYRQESTLDGWQNLLLLWGDTDGILDDPLHLVRPLGGDNRRRNLRIDWSGPLSRKMATMRAQDLDELQPEHEHRQMEGDDTA